MGGSTLLLLFSGSGTTPVVSSPSLSEAIRQRFAGTVALEWVDGGLTFGNAPTFDPPVNYYAVFWQLGTIESFSTGVGYVDMTLFQFDVYAELRDDCTLMMDEITAIFNHRVIPTAPLVYRNGQAFNAIPGTAAMDKTEYPDDQGRLLKRLHKDFRFYSNRTLPT